MKYSISFLKWVEKVLKGDRYSPDTDSSWLWQKLGCWWRYGKRKRGGGGVGKEVLIYSGRTGAGGETVDMVLGECVCVCLCWCV